jgi:hypothetical protein
MRDSRQGSIISGIAFDTFNNTGKNLPSSTGFARWRNPGSDVTKRTQLIDLAMSGANFVVDIANNGCIVECSCDLLPPPGVLASGRDKALPCGIANRHVPSKDLKLSVYRVPTFSVIVYS